MWNSKIFSCLFLFVILTVVKTEANSTACEQKEKHIAILDLAKESISKAKDLHPSCVNDDKLNADNDTSNTTECGVKEKVSAYLDIAMNLIEDAKKNFTTCEMNKNFTKNELFHKKPIDCSEILENGNNKSGVYTIWPRHRTLRRTSIIVLCDMETDGGGWTMIQRRGQFTKKFDFNQDWNTYKRGFGNYSEEFWIGNDNIVALTNQRNYLIRFDMETVDKKHFYATYPSFWIEDETAGFMVHFGNYSGTAGDGINLINGTKFSTKDKRNDKSSEKKPCTDHKMGGWWYSNCGMSNPNGVNLPSGKDDSKYINWSPLTKYDALLAIDMKIRVIN